MIVLPMLALLLATLCVRREGEPTGRAVLLAAALWGVVVVGGSELLGVLHLLQRGWVLLIWLAAVATTLVCWLRRPARWRKLDLHLPPERMVLGGVLCVVVLGAIVAVAAAPNTWDAMTYHLPRVMHWMQNRSLAPYPTAIERQLHHPPFAELVVLHFELLSGGDRFAALVQWLAMVGSLVSGWLVAGQLGGGRLARSLAVVVCATLPMGILESTSTHTDYVEAFWLIAFAYFVLCAVREAPVGRTGLLAGALALTPAGACLGLALLTKATAYLFAAPFCAWLAVVRWRRAGVRSLGPLLLMAAVVLALNVGYFWRNVVVYGRPLGPEAIAEKYTNATHAPAAMLSNVVRNVALQFSGPIVGARVERAVSRLHHALGIAVDDPRTTWIAEDVVVGRGRHEDHAGNPWHTVLVACSLVAVVAVSRLRTRRLLLFALTLVVGFLTFCFYLKWQPYGSRHVLPLLVMASPMVAVTLVGLVGEKAGRWGGVLLLVLALPYVLRNGTRPLIGPGSVLTTRRVDQYFINRPELRAPYLMASQVLASSGCGDVGLWIGPDGWEYPFWELLERDYGRRVPLRHIVFGEDLAKLDERRDAVPICAILRVDPAPELGSMPQMRGRIWRQGPVAVLLVH